MIFMGINHSDDFLIGKWRNAFFAPYIIYFFIYLLFWLAWYKFYAIITSTFPPSVDLTGNLLSTPVQGRIFTSTDS